MADPTVLSDDATAPQQQDAALRDEMLYQDALANDDAVAMGPEPEPTRDEPLAATPEATTDAPLAEQTGETPREQLTRGKMTGAEIDAVELAVSRFNKTMSSAGRSIDALTLGLLWQSERPYVEGKPFTLVLDRNDPNYGVAYSVLFTDLELMSQPPSDERLRCWKITAVGHHQFGMKDVFGHTTAVGESPDSFYDLAAGKARWASRMQIDAGWSAALPFESTNPIVDREVAVPGTHGPLYQYYETRLTTEDAAGFLISVAARFTQQLWQLPQELARVGVQLDCSVEAIPLVEPTLAYLCYLSRAPSAAGAFEALVFLRQFCDAAARSIVVLGGGPTFALEPLIATINTWLPRLRDGSWLGTRSSLRAIVYEPSTTSTRVDGSLTASGLALLDGLAASYGSGSVPLEPELDPAARAELEALTEAWSTFAARVAFDLADRTPIELFFHGFQSSSGVPPMFTRSFGTLGFGVSNYGLRFLRATGQERMGGSYQHKVPS